MPRMNMIIDDFSVGEVSPLVEARLASGEFQDGLRELLNMAPDAHGPLMGRPGFEFIATIDPGGGTSATLLQITFSQVRYYVIELTDLRIRVFDNTGKIVLDTTTPYTHTQLHGDKGLQHYYKAAQAPVGNKMVIVGAHHPPYELIFDLEANTATFQIITFTAEPAEWSATPDNYPTTVTFFQNRSWWGGCQDDPSTLWSSKSNVYYDITIGSLADDAIKFIIARQGRIRWIEGSKNLLVGTDFNEFIFEAVDGVLHPGDIRVERQSSYGSSWIQPRMIGNEVMYVTSDRRKMRTMWYRILDVGGWSSRDATFTAEHITEVNPVHMIFARNPYSVVMLTREDGEVACCSYFREENGEPAIGWYRMKNDIFKFKCLAAPENEGRSEVWAVVTDGTNLKLLRKTMRDYKDDQEVFLDCYQRRENASPVYTAVFNRGGFYSDTVDVVGDNFHYPAQKLEPDGSITLPNPHTIISAGHPYMQRLVTMPVLERSSDANLGHQMKRWNKVFLRTLRSYRPLVNGWRPPERHVETNNDVAEPLVDGFIKVIASNTWNRGGQLTIEQDLPYRLLLTGIYGEMSAEQL